jgi:hypothetical protein
MTSLLLVARRTSTIVALALGVVICCGVPARAQDSGSNPSFLLLGADYGAPERFSGSLAGLFPLWNPTPTRSPGRFTPMFLEIRGRVGVGGYGVGIGPRILRYGPVVGPDAKLTVIRTFSSPLHAVGSSTFVGVEVGYHMLGRVSIGVARQVDGPADRRDTLLTWGVGLAIPYGMWRW